MVRVSYLCKCIPGLMQNYRVSDESILLQLTPKHAINTTNGSTEIFMRYLYVTGHMQEIKIIFVTGHMEETKSYSSLVICRK